MAEPVNENDYAIRWPPLRTPYDVALSKAVQWCVYKLDPDMWPCAKPVPAEPRWITQAAAWEYVARELWAFTERAAERFPL